MDGVTTRELYDAIQGLHTRVVVLCEKVDRLGPDHEKRLRDLEKSRWPLPTIAVLVATGTLVLMLLGRLNVV